MCFDPCMGQPRKEPFGNTQEKQFLLCSIPNAGYSSEEEQELHTVVDAQLKVADQVHLAGSKKYCINMYQLNLQLGSVVLSSNWHLANKIHSITCKMSHKKFTSSGR